MKARARIALILFIMGLVFSVLNPFTRVEAKPIDPPYPGTPVYLPTATPDVHRTVQAPPELFKRRLR